MRPVSQSDVLPFERCPALWHATRNRRLDSGSRWTRIGTACHVACEVVTLAVLGADSRALYLVARDAVTAHAAAVDLPPDEMHEALDVMDGATAADSAISFYVPDGWTAAAEVRLGLDADFAIANTDVESAARPLAYYGTLDRVQWNESTGELEVWDWKTSHDYMSSADLLLDVQARWYAMLALAWFPAATIVTFKRVMLRLGYTATAKFVRGEKWHGQIMDRARRLLHATQAPATANPAPGFSPGKLVERFGAWCGDCPVRGQCPTWIDARDVGRASNFGAPREELARRLGALKAAAAELDERLRADVAAHGPIRLGDGTALGFHAKRAKTLRGSRDEVLGELRAAGMGPEREREWFAPSDKAMPGLVRDAVEKLEPNRGMAAAMAERLLAPATGFNFEVKEVEDA